jgi:hypothetical protein
MCNNLNENDWTYILDMPGLYSLVRRNEKSVIALLDEEANVCKAGYGNANNARLDLSYNSMVPAIFGTEDQGPTPPFSCD